EQTMVFAAHERSGRAIVIPRKDKKEFPIFDALLTLPSSHAGHAVIVLHDDEGVTDFTISRAELFAAEGWVVLTPNLQWRSPQANPPTERDQIVQDVRDCIDHLRDMPAVVGAAHKIGILGYGTGATWAALCCAELKELECAVGYYPTNLEAHVANIQTAKPVLVHLPGASTTTPPSAQSQIKKALTSLQHGYAHIYKEMHVWFDRENHASFDGAASSVAHTRTLSVLKRGLGGPHYDLEALWDRHCEVEFATRDVSATMATMVAEPYVNHIPTMTGGVGAKNLAHFYRHHFVHSNPDDMTLKTISRTVGVDRLVDELIMSFTHTKKVDWILPGIQPTGKHVEVPLVAIITFRGNKLLNEHIYWDQASVLKQIGVINTTSAMSGEDLPICGAEQAKKLVDKSLPSNEPPPSSLPQLTRSSSHLRPAAMALSSTFVPMVIAAPITTAAPTFDPAMIAPLDLSCQSLNAFYPNVPAQSCCGWVEVMPLALNKITCDAANTSVISVVISDTVVRPLDVLAFENLPGLKAIDLGFNNMAGSIPPTITQCTQLQSLNLQINNITGSIPDLSPLVNLQILFMQGNPELSGPLPISNSMNNLINVNFAGNAVTGPIPSIVNLTQLENLFLDNNNISGPFPNISGLTNLKSVSLQNNHLSGTIPSLTTLQALIYM
ncbi:hypothetical protein HK101_004940, partial [Irineochytrium annulatum]